WDALGVRETAGAMRASGVSVAPWVAEMLGAGFESFYREEGGRLSYYDPASKTYLSAPAGDRCAELRAAKGAA
ncbi:MAG TPA: hypothetical protein VEQ42_11815, partial [Pyrinomonadaceae bacterium]|nr:hypothetical protein [Pyrinomonadaceae bacterium]